MMTVFNVVEKKELLVNVTLSESHLEGDTQARSEIRSDIVSVIREHFNGQDTISFVDLDTGDGSFVTRFAQLLRSYFPEVNGMGMETFRWLVDQARGLGHNVYHGNAQIEEDYIQAGLADESKEIVTINNIESAPEALIRQAGRILKSAGLLERGGFYFTCDKTAKRSPQSQYLPNASAADHD